MTAKVATQRNEAQHAFVARRPKPSEQTVDEELVYQSQSVASAHGTELTHQACNVEQCIHRPELPQPV